MLTGAFRCFCGSPLDGFVGSFQYGFVHGEGRCSLCGHPGRADHYVKDADGEDVVTLRFVLLYHPDELTAAETEG